jgi:hypothetical protein
MRDMGEDVLRVVSDNHSSVGLLELLGEVNSRGGLAG